MIRTIDVGVDGSALNMLDEFARDEEVVNAPADISVAGASE